MNHDTMRKLADGPEAKRHRDLHEQMQPVVDRQVAQVEAGRMKAEEIRFGHKLVPRGDVISFRSIKR